MPALLVLSVNNRYIELLRANIRYGNNKEREKILTGCRFHAQVIHYTVYTLYCIIHYTVA